MEGYVLLREIRNVGELLFETIGKHLGAVSPGLDPIPDVEEEDLAEQMICHVGFVLCDSRPCVEPIAEVLTHGLVICKERIVGGDGQGAGYTAEEEVRYFVFQPDAEVGVLFEVRFADGEEFAPDKICASGDVVEVDVRGLDILEGEGHAVEAEGLQVSRMTVSGRKRA